MSLCQCSGVSRLVDHVEETVFKCEFLWTSCVLIDLRLYCLLLQEPCDATPRRHALRDTQGDCARSVFFLDFFVCFLKSSYLKRIRAHFLYHA